MKGQEAINLSTSIRGHQSVLQLEVVIHSQSRRGRPSIINYQSIRGRQLFSVKRGHRPFSIQERLSTILQKKREASNHSPSKRGHQPFSINERPATIIHQNRGHQLPSIKREVNNRYPEILETILPALSRPQLPRCSPRRSSRSQLE